MTCSSPDWRASRHLASNRSSKQRADANGDCRAHRRPRPKLSRAERIAADKARRAAAADVITSSGLGLSMFGLDQETDGIGAGAEGPKRWGSSGGDVVQELRDVTRKVMN